MSGDAMADLKKAICEAGIKTATRKVTKLPPLKVGDKVIRWLGGEIAQPMVVLKVTPDLIRWGGPEYPGADWDFDPQWGCEVDDRFDWGPPPKATGSYITLGDS